MAPLLILRQSSASTSLVKQAVEHTLDGGKLNILVLHDDNIPFDWHKLQKFLCAIYVAQLSVAYAGGAPLFDCNVVFEKWCGYDFGLEKDIDTVYVSCQAELERVKAWNLSRAQAGLPELVPFQLQNAAESSLDILSTETAKDYEKTFPRVAVGGTFDHLHAGHKILLTMTALIATESMVVGVTDDSMLTSKKFKEQIESIETRLKRVQGYLQLIRRDIRYEVVPISDPFGPTITDPSIVALVCSEETEKGGEAVNKEREKRGFPPLDLRIIDVISSDNASVEKQDISTLKISSTWIREYLSQIRNR